MLAEPITLKQPLESAFPFAEVQRRLRNDLEEAVGESVILHGGWEPMLDSLRMVSVVSGLEDLFDFSLPPEKLIKRGGYKSVDEGVKDMSDRLHRLWTECQ